MCVIYEKDSCRLITHDRQLQLYEENDENIAKYQLKQILFENFKRKQKIKLLKTNDDDSSEMKIQVETFLKTCKIMNLFSTTNDADIDRLKSANINLMNSFYATSSDLGVFHGENKLSVGKVITMSESTFLIPAHSRFFNKAVSDIENCLSENEANQFDFIVVDPPWKNRYIKRIKKAGGNKQGYSMMSDEEIMHIPIEKFIKPSSIVIIWSTNSKNHITAIKEKFIDKWNLKLLSTWQWVKIDKNGELFCSIDGHKKPFEQIYVATNRENINHNQELEKDFLIFSQPSSIHSHKPPLLDIFRKYLPPNPKCLEIFARSIYENFTSIGLEVLKLQNMILYETVSS